MTARRRGVAGPVVAMLLAAALTIVVRAPAAWLGDWVAGHGRLRLVDARGTIWQGSAMLALTDGRRALLLPGRLGWTLRPAALFAGRLEAVLSYPALGRPVDLRYTLAQGLALKSGRAQAPAAVLAAFGTPFDTLRPGGVLAAHWSDIRIDRGGYSGSVQIDWRDAQSALSPVAPLGSFRLAVTGTGTAEARVRLDTLSGPLRLQGEGTLRAGHIDFKGVASADPDMRGPLQGLLGVLGERSGDNVVLSLRI